MREADASKGQTELFEYIIATFFIVLILIVVIFMLSSYQAGQLELEQQRVRDLRTVALLKRILSSPLLAKDDSVLDDTKLIAALGMCREMEEYFGKKWYALVMIMDDDWKRGTFNYCKEGEYSKECNVWVLCRENIDPEKKSGYTVPVNVVRRMYWVMRRGTSSKVEPAIVEVGIYAEE
jgi:hypothetical protein